MELVRDVAACPLYRRLPGGRCGRFLRPVYVVQLGSPNRVIAYESPHIDRGGFERSRVRISLDAGGV